MVFLSSRKNNCCSKWVVRYVTDSHFGILNGELSIFSYNFVVFGCDQKCISGVIWTSYTENQWSRVLLIANASLEWETQLIHKINFQLVVAIEFFVKAMSKDGWILNELLKFILYDWDKGSTWPLIFNERSFQFSFWLADRKQYRDLLETKGRDFIHDCESTANWCFLCSSVSGNQCLFLVQLMLIPCSIKIKIISQIC